MRSMHGAPETLLESCLQELDEQINLLNAIPEEHEREIGNAVALVALAARAAFSEFLALVEDRNNPNVSVMTNTLERALGAIPVSSHELPGNHQHIAKYLDDLRELDAN